MLLVQHVSNKKLSHVPVSSLRPNVMLLYEALLLFRSSSKPIWFVFGRHFRWCRCVALRAQIRVPLKWGYTKSGMQAGAKLIGFWGSYSLG